MTRKETLKFAVIGMKTQMEALKAEIDLVEAAIAGRVVADNNGQPHCPEHGINYQEKTCASCAHINGNTLPSEKKAPKKPRSAESRANMKAAAKKRWEVRKAAAQATKGDQP